MDLKKFIIIALSIVLTGILVLVGIFFFSGDVNSNDLGSVDEKYKATAQDKEALAAIVSDYVLRTGNFGVQTGGKEFVSDDAMLDYLDQVRLAGNLPNEQDFISRENVYNFSKELLSPYSNMMYSFSDVESLSIKDDVSKLRSYEIILNDLEVMDEGGLLSITETADKMPSLIVKASVSNVAVQRVFTSPPVDIPGNIYATEYIVKETTKNLDQVIEFMAVKSPEQGWLIYEVRVVEDGRYFGSIMTTSSSLNDLFADGLSRELILPVVHGDHSH